MSETVCERKREREREVSVGCHLLSFSFPLLSFSSAWAFACVSSTPPLFTPTITQHGKWYIYIHLSLKWWIQIDHLDSLDLESDWSQQDLPRFDMARSYRWCISFTNLKALLHSSDSNFVRVNATGSLWRSLCFSPIAEMAGCGVDWKSHASPRRATRVSSLSVSPLLLLCSFLLSPVGCVTWSCTSSLISSSELRMQREWQSSPDHQRWRGSSVVAYGGCRRTDSYEKQQIEDREQAERRRRRIFDCSSTFFRSLLTGEWHSQVSSHFTNVGIGSIPPTWISLKVLALSQHKQMGQLPWEERQHLLDSLSLCDSLDWLTWTR